MVAGYFAFLDGCFQEFGGSGRMVVQDVAVLAYAFVVSFLCRLEFSGQNAKEGEEVGPCTLVVSNIHSFRLSGYRWA